MEVFKIDRRWVWGLLCILPIIAFGACVWSEFVSLDDTYLITENAWIRGLSIANIVHAFTSYDPELYLPITTISYLLNYAIAGLEPWIYHGTNLLLHILNGLLVFVIVQKLTKNEVVAIVVSLLFAVHPFHTEAIAWASARKDVLSATFLFASVLLWIVMEESQSPRFYVASLVCFALGLMSKVGIILAPVLFLLLPWILRKRISMNTIVKTIPYFILSGIFGIVAVFGKVAQGELHYEKTLIWCRSVTLSLQHLVIPTGLSAFYPYTQQVSLHSLDLLASVVAVVTMSVLSLLFIRRSSWPFFTWAWFALLLLPSFANLAHTQNELWDIYVGSDRYGYAASVAPLILIGFGCSWLYRRWPAICLSIFTVVLTVFCILSFRQTLVWKNSESFFRGSIAASPNSFLAHNNLGTILVKKGDIAGAAQEYGIALAIRPDSITYYDMGLLLEHVKKPDLALQAYQKSVDQSPLQKDAFVRIGSLQSQQGNFAEALIALKEALALDPTDKIVINAISGVEEGKAVLVLVEQ